MLGQPDWDDVRFFLAVYRSHTIRSAAKALGVSHSTVSRRLENFEGRLKTRLFHRQPDGFVLTSTGESILNAAEKVESEMLSLERDAMGQDGRLSGKIKITVPPPIAQYLITPILAKFNNEYPDITLEIDATYSASDLSRRDADIALRIHTPPDEHLLGRRLPDFVEYVYVSKDYAKTHTFMGPNANANWIGWGDNQELPSWVKKSQFPFCRVGVNSSDMLTHLHMAKADMGMAILPCFIGDLEEGLIRVPECKQYAARQAWVLTHPDLKTTERVRVCVRFLVDEIKKLEQLIAGNSLRAD